MTMHWIGACEGLLGKLVGRVAVLAAIVAVIDVAEQRAELAVAVAAHPFENFADALPELLAARVVLQVGAASRVEVDAHVARGLVVHRTADALEAAIA